MKSVLNKLVLFLVCVSFSASAFAVKIIVPFSVGTNPDIISRYLASELSKTRNERFIVENQTGASGIIGIVNAKKAKPDGQTLLFITNAVLLTSLVVTPKPYDILEDFSPVVGVGEVEFGMVINKAKGIRTVDELIKYAKANPNKLTYGSAGYAGAYDIAMRVFMHDNGIELLHVPFKDYRDYSINVMNGIVDVAILNPQSITTLVEKNIVNPLVDPHHKMTNYFAYVISKSADERIRLSYEVGIKEILSRKDTIDLFNKLSVKPYFYDALNLWKRLDIENKNLKSTIPLLLKDK